MSITNEDLERLAGYWARRYAGLNRQEYDDLFQEAYLAALESGREDLPTITNAMRKACSRWLNVSLKPVSVPQSGELMRLVGALRRGEELATTTSENALLAAIQGEVVDYKDAELSVEDTQVSDLELQQEIASLQSMMVIFLTDDERQVMNLLFFKSVTGAEVARRMNTTKQWVYTLRNRSLDLLKDKVKHRDRL